MEVETVDLSSIYENEILLNQYLLFHYGELEDQLPFSFGPHDALNFPQRCVESCLEVNRLPNKARALDLGCSVGRSAFELSRHCEYVLALDKSQRFITAAEKIQNEGFIDCKIQQEAGNSLSKRMKLPTNVNAEKVEFICQDVLQFDPKMRFDVILAANLICRLPDPANFLRSLHQWIVPDGQLILISPYSWLEEFTPQSAWLKGDTGLNSIKIILEKHFTLKKCVELPFLLREHQRKYQWGISQASVWIRK